ncbi:MAG: BamA/TamA family outer membrane protein, partial [Pseudomonadota bacterium]
RGFGTSGIGPRDAGTNDALGGEIYYVGSLEANFPLGLPEELGIRGRVFADAGSLLEVSDDSSQINDTGSLRASAGVGLGWRSPFGPINIDFAFPFLKEDFDETESIRISFGTNF